MGLDFLPPFFFAGIRFATATVVLVILARILRAPIPRDRVSWAIMLFLGVVQISLPYGLVFWGEQYISSGLSAVLFATLPFFVAIFAHLLSVEKLSRLKVAGIVLSFAGLVAIFWRDMTTMQTIGATSSLLGSLAVVGSAASGGLGNVVAKQYAERIDPATNVLVQHIVGAAALLSIGLATESKLSLDVSPVAIIAVLYLGVVGSALGFFALYWLLKKASATNVSMITFFNPVFALILGWFVLHEMLEPSVGLGTGMILAGVYLALKPAGRYL